MSHAPNSAVIFEQAFDPDRAHVEALQHRAYAWNAAQLGVTPLPLQWDYRTIFAECEVWIVRGAADIANSSDAGRDAGSTDGDSIDAQPGDAQPGPMIAALILRAGPDGLIIESISVDPDHQQGGLGGELLAFAEKRAHTLGLDALTLYTGRPLMRLIAWYQKVGFELTDTETLTDRQIVHMRKALT